jgi:hypothetical protein
VARADLAFDQLQQLVSGDLPLRPLVNLGHVRKALNTNFVSE